jgi:hypothetical protein
LTFEEFQSCCLKKHCLRHTIYTERTCSREGKQRRCFDKYLKKKQKPSTQNVKYDELREEVWQRDSTLESPPKEGKVKDWKKFCKFWKCLSLKEKVQFEELNNKDLWLCKYLDAMHWKGKGSRPDLKLDSNNVTLCNRLVHRLLTDYKHPITRENITSEEVDNWYQRIFDNVDIK